MVALPLLLRCSLLAAASVPNELPSVSSAARLPPIEPRVQALLARMTPEAKVAQLMIGRGPKPGSGNWPDGFGCTPGMSYADAGAGTGMALSHAEQAAANDALQRWAIENTTYGIPLTFYAETLHTAQNGATIFPAPAGLGATWNLPLVRKVAETIGYEARLKGIDRAWSPELQVATDPRFGRFDESFAEDPHLVAHMGVAFATGLHGGAAGGPDTYGNFSAVLTEAKHYAGYGQSGMDGLYTDIANATLFNVYLRPWRAFARKAGGRGIMASHQALNGVPNHANHWLLTEVWRGKFGANHSFIASDQDDVTRLYVNSRGQGYGVAPDCLHAGASALNAGMDSALGYTCFENLTEALKQGLIDNAALDRAAGNVLRAKFAAGLFDGHAYSDPSGSRKIRTASAQQLAYETAVESVTLVRNQNGTLPLRLGAAGSGAVRRIAVVGPNAGCAAEGATSCSYDGHDPVKAQMGPYVWDSGESTVTVLQAIRRSVSKGQLEQVTYHQGAWWTSYNDSLLEAAVDGAKAADVVIAVVGDSDASYGRGTCAEGIDADTLDLPGGQLALLDAVADTGTPVILVLMNGRPATFGAGPFAATGPNNELLQRLAAVLVAWRPGEAGGSAIWDLLLGKENFSGHLTQNWLRSVGAVRGPSNPWYQQRRPGLPFQYVTEATTPLFSFGFGLSYATFSFDSALQLSTGVVTAADAFVAKIRITSVGPAGKAVAQVYASHPPTGGFVGYQYSLLCFAKVPIPANSAGVTANVRCEASDLEVYDTSSGEYIVPAGSYALTAAQHAGELPRGPTAQLLLVDTEHYTDE